MLVNRGNGNHWFGFKFGVDKTDMSVVGKDRCLLLEQHRYLLLGPDKRLLLRQERRLTVREGRSQSNSVRGTSVLYQQ